MVAAIEFLLTQRGYEVHTAQEGSEALGLVASVVPDLVLLDVMMPKMSGYEVCQNIRKRDEWRGIKIVMLSAKGRDAEVNKGLAIGADEHGRRGAGLRPCHSRPGNGNRGSARARELCVVRGV